MKVRTPHSAPRTPHSTSPAPHSALRTPHSFGFTLIEIALCLAIIAFALIAILGVLPLGLNTQKENRQDDIIRADEAIFMSAICNGELGLDYLAKHVDSITVNGKTYKGFTSGRDIVGLLSTPKFVSLGNGATLNNSPAVAAVRSISGLASEKYPQDNTIVQDLGLSYEMVSEVIPTSFSPLDQTWTNISYEVRLTFRWPHNMTTGANGIGRQVFRSSAGGRLSSSLVNGVSYYFFQPNQY